MLCPQGMLHPFFMQKTLSSLERRIMDTIRIDTLKKSLANTMNLLLDIQTEVSCGIIDVLTAKEKENILKKEIIEKKKLIIAEVHIGKRGNPLSMGKFNESKGLYIVRCADNIKVSSTTEEGLLDEVKRLKAKGLNREYVSMQGLGYKEILSYLDGECSLEDAVYLIKRDTRHFAKRQLTWFRREKDVIWVDKDQFEYDEDRILEFILEKMKERGI